MVSDLRLHARRTGYICGESVLPSDVRVAPFASREYPPILPQLIGFDKDAHRETLMSRRSYGASWLPVVRTLVARRERFHHLVADALDSLPPDIRERLDNVQVVVEDRGGPPGTLALYHGIPQTERDGWYAGVLPDVITLYREPIEAAAGSDEALPAEIKRTVLHEVAHHFGISDERLREIDRY